MALDQISNIPAGGVAAQTLQDAINELDLETAKLATEQTWTAQKIPFSGTLTDAATIAWDCNVQGQVVKVTLAGNRTLAAPTNVREFAVYIISVNQDATGSRTLTWNSAFKFQQGTAPTLNTAASSNNIFVFIGGPAGALYSTDLFYNQSLNTTNSPVFAGVTADAITIGVSTASTITTSSGNLVLDSATGTTQINDNLTVTGNLTVSGTTTTVNSTTVTVADPIITLGGATAPTADDNKDRGVEFRWHNGTVAKVGFFGFDDSTGKLVFIPDATNTSEVFTGTKGVIDANVEWADVLNKPDPVITLGGDLTGSVTLTDLGSGTLNATIAANSVALGTDTTGNYVGSLVAGTGISLSGVAGEGWSPTVTNSDPGSAQAIFKNIAVSTQPTIVADSNNDTLTLVAGTNVTITTDDLTDTITISADDVSVDWSQVQNKPDPIITLAGDLSGSVTLTDLASGTLTASIVANSVALGTDTTGNYAASVAVAGTGLSLTGIAGEGTDFTVTSNATNLNTASTIVARDISGNFSAGTITAALSGNASTATTLQTTRFINGTGFDGSADINVTANTPNAVSFHFSGGGAPGTTFDGSTPVTISYTTVGAAADTHTHSEYLALTGGIITGGLRTARVALSDGVINVTSGNCFTKTISAPTVFSIATPYPGAGVVASFILDLTNGGFSSVTWWTGVKWAGGIAPTLTASGRDVLGFFTHDGGTTWTGLVLGIDVK